MESQLECLDIRLKQQEQEVADIMDLLKKRAEIEKKYSRDMEALARSMKHKHKDLLGGAGTSVTSVLRQLILETGEVARLHSGLDDVMGGELTGICSNIISDSQLQHRQVNARLQTADCRYLHRSLVHSKHVNIYVRK